MENFQGDLTDIIRASSSSISKTPVPESEHISSSGDWKFPPSDLAGNTPGDFGDPFSDMRDPLSSLNGSTFFFNTQNIKNLPSTVEEHDRGNIFARMLQISPNPTPTAGDSPVPVVKLQIPAGGSIINANNVSSGGLQISSPRNPGIKRRKSQAKKVVCIPAPAPANSRASGEIVPSDLWAWRKYGQKPIKGSPYPRGYYRCSSSKGCSARKQVERSRTDSNMLVITYTSEHNHPWPTQRNALAGSTRAMPSKIHKQTCLNQDHNKDNINRSPIAGTSNIASVKEEMDDLDEKDLSMDEGFPPSYKPIMEDDFFVGFDDIEADPISLLLNQEFRLGHHDNQERDKKGLDLFNIFDGWQGNNDTTFGEAKRGL